MITQHGAVCDVCGNYILPITPEAKILQFTITAIPDRIMQCHVECGDKIQAAGDDWTKLPVGPLKMAFENKHNSMT